MLLYLRVNDVVHVVSVGVRAVSYGVPVFFWQATQGTRSKEPPMVHAHAEQEREH